MSVDLGDILAHAFTTSAPTAGGNDSRPDTGPGNGGRPGPCVTAYEAHLASLDTDAFVAELRAGTADVHATIARHRKTRADDLRSAA